MTTRKPAAKKAAPRRAPRPTPVAAPDAVDLLADLATGELPPVDIVLRGHRAQVRRTYTGDEAVRLFELVREDKLEEMLDLLTTDGPGLWGIVYQLQPEHAVVALNRIINLSGLYEGELLAPLQEYTAKAGAPSTDESATTTG